MANYIEKISAIYRWWSAQEIFDAKTWSLSVNNSVYIKYNLLSNIAVVVMSVEYSCLVIQFLVAHSWSTIINDLCGLCGGLDHVLINSNGNYFLKHSTSSRAVPGSRLTPWRWRRRIIMRIKAALLCYYMYIVISRAHSPLYTVWISIIPAVRGDQQLGLAPATEFI